MQLQSVLSHLAALVVGAAPVLAHELLGHQALHIGYGATKCGIVGDTI